MKLIKKIRRFIKTPNLKVYILYMKIGTYTTEIILALFVYLFRTRKHKLMPLLKKGFESHPAPYDFSDEQFNHMLDRIIDAYKNAKVDQKDIPISYQVGARYQNSIEKKYQPILKALNERDHDSLRKIFENYQRSSQLAGMGTSGEEYLEAKRNRIFKYKYLNRWYNYYSKLMDVSKEVELSYSLVGNPAGIYMDGNIIHPEGIRFHYTSIEICELLKNINEPVICEIGTGSGCQAYKVIDNFKKPLTYCLFDIPEVLVFASFFLMANFPDKKILLHCEKDMSKIDITEYDIILMPNFMVPYLKDESVDLFFNDCSFTEMDCRAVKEYFKQIERVNRKYFMHVNHTLKSVWNFDGIRTENLPAGKIEPDPEYFKRIYKHYRVFRDRNEKIFYFFSGVEHFAFLYEKFKSTKKK